MLQSVEALASGIPAHWYGLRAREDDYNHGGCHWGSYSDTELVHLKKSWIAMGIRAVCPNGHRLNLKSFLAGRRGVCPDCGARFRIPEESSDIPQPELPAKHKDKDDADFSKGAANSSSSPQAPVHIASSLSGEQNGQDVWYVHATNGEQYGPASEQILRNWIAEGRVTDDCLIWRDGWAEWKAANTVIQTPTSPPSEEPVSQPLPQSHAKEEAIPETSVAPFVPRSEPMTYARRKSSNFGWVLGLVLGLITIALLVGLFMLFQSGDVTFGRSN
jgi:hypothetical protein